MGSELIRAFGRFVYRDLLYIAGGLIILWFTSLGLGMNSSALSNHQFVLLFILAYPVGFVAQEFLAVIGAVRARDFDYVRTIWIWRVFNRGAALEPKYVVKLDEKKKLKKLSPRGGLDSVVTPCLNYFNHESDTATERFKAKIERLLLLRDIGTKFGAALVVGPVLGVIAHFPEGNCNYPSLSLAVFFLGALFCGVFLCAQSHFRSYQIAWHILAWKEVQESRTLSL